MQIRAMTPGTGWSWLKRGINLGVHNPRAVFGAAALLMAVGLVPSCVQVLAQAVLHVEGGAELALVGVFALVSLVVYPLLIGGFLRVIDASEHGRPTHATALFDAFRGGQGAGRMIGFSLAMTLVYVIVVFLVLRSFGPGFMEWYWKVMDTAMQQPGALDPKTLPPPPADVQFGRVFLLSALAALFLGGTYAIGFGQVALASRSVGGALADGVVGTLKNVLPILVMAVCAFVMALGLIICVGIAGAFLGVLGGLISPALGLALALPVYFGMLLVLYVVMFGVMYFLWRDVCGAEPALPDDAIAA